MSSPPIVAGFPDRKYRFTSVTSQIIPMLGEIDFIYWPQIPSPLTLQHVVRVKSTKPHDHGAGLPDTVFKKVLSPFVPYPFDHSLLVERCKL